MTDARYVVDCCGAKVAEVEVTGGHATIHPPAGEEVYRVAPPQRVTKENVKLPPEQMAALDWEVEYEARDKIHGLTMNWTSGHHVSEVLWPDHSTWVVRCGCDKLLTVKDAHMPKLARILAAGNWSATDGVAPLGVLHAAMTRSDI